MAEVEISSKGGQNNLFSLKINGITQNITEGRGWNFAIIDPTTYRLKEFKNFDTYEWKPSNGYKCSHQPYYQLLNYV